MHRQSITEPTEYDLIQCGQDFETKLLCKKAKYKMDKGPFGFITLLGGSKEAVQVCIIVDLLFGILEFSMSIAVAVVVEFDIDAVEENIQVTDLISANISSERSFQSTSEGYQYMVAVLILVIACSCVQVWVGGVAFSVVTFVSENSESRVSFRQVSMVTHTIILFLTAGLFVIMGHIEVASEEIEKSANQGFDHSLYIVYFWIVNINIMVVINLCCTNSLILNALMEIVFGFDLILISFSIQNIEIGYYGNNVPIFCYVAYVIGSFQMIVPITFLVWLSFQSELINPSKLDIWGCLTYLIAFCLGMLVFTMTHSLEFRHVVVVSFVMWGALMNSVMMIYIGSSIFSDRTDHLICVHSHEHSFVPLQLEHEHRNTQRKNSSRRRKGTTIFEKCMFRDDDFKQTNVDDRTESPSTNIPDPRPLAHSSALYSLHTFMLLNDYVSADETLQGLASESEEQLESSKEGTKDNETNIGQEYTNTSVEVDKADSDVSSGSESPVDSRKRLKPRQDEAKGHGLHESSRGNKGEYSGKGFTKNKDETSNVISEEVKKDAPNNDKNDEIDEENSAEHENLTWFYCLKNAIKKKVFQAWQRKVDNSRNSKE